MTPAVPPLSVTPAPGDGTAATTHPTSGWSQLHDRFYRKHALFDMMWTEHVDTLANYHVAIACKGGPIALVPSPEKSVRTGGSAAAAARIISSYGGTAAASTRLAVSVFSSAGAMLLQVPWPTSTPKAVGVRWTDDERLVIVLEDGTARILSLDGESTQFSLGADAIKYGVTRCRIHDRSLVAVTGDYRFLSIPNIDEPRSVLLAALPEEQLPYDGSPLKAWDVVPAAMSLGRGVEVLVAVRNTLFSVDGREARDLQLTAEGPFSRVTVSPNAKLIALFADSGNVLVYTADFQQKLLEFSSKSKIPPRQLAWCGNDSVLVAWDQLILMLGPFGDWIKYTYDGAFVIFSEDDGARIVSDTKCEFLERVPDVVEDIFKIGSTHPASMLYDAYDSFEKRNPKADDIIRSLQSNLSTAIDACIAAAGHEFSIKVQKSLLRAAAFGKSFIEDCHSEAFTRVCRMLRILNAIRDHDIGLPMTYTQLDAIGVPELIRRLLRRNHHLLALRISEYMKLKQEVVLVDWACSMIKRSRDTDEELCTRIVAKLGSHDVSFAQIAKLAFDSGRPLLSSRLLDHEKHPFDQVPLLLSMQEYEPALVKAVESGDTDLVFMALLHLKRQLQLADFFRLVSRHPPACRLLEVYARSRNPDLLRDFFYQDDRRYDAAMFEYEQAWRFEGSKERMAKMETAIGLVKNIKEHAAVAKEMDDAITLVRLQEQLEREHGPGYIGSTVSATIRKLIRAKQSGKVAKLRKDFRVPDKRFWWVMLQTLAEMKDWEELDRFARSKKSPIGYEPFVEECIKQGNTLEAKRYILKCDTGVRAPLYAQIGATREAIDAAFGSKDTSTLQEIRSSTNNAAVVEEISRMLLQLGLTE